MCGKDEISLPFDILCDRQRNLAAPFGAYNSYYEAACVRLTRRVPVKNYYRAYLETSGVSGKADVYADGAYLGSVTHDGRSLLPLPAKAQTLSYDISAVNTGRYTGCGIADGARILYADAPLFIAPYGLCVRAREAAGKAALDVSVEVVNESDAKRKAVITLYVFGPRGRRLTKKTRTVQIAADSVRTFTVRAAFSRYTVWDGAAGVYTLQAELACDGESVDEAGTVFGVTGHKEPETDVCLARDNGPLGAASYPTAEARRLALIRAAGGTGAVTPYPGETLLCAADAAGMSLTARLFDALEAPDTPFTPAYFDRDRDERILWGVKALRNHPCVAAYALPAGQAFDELSDEIRALDDKPVLRTEDKTYYFDYLGSAEDGRPAIYNDRGLFDCTGTAKAGAGRPGEVRMTVTGADGVPRSVWDAAPGEAVTVEVFTSGEVVSLLLDGRQIGRKLADRDAGGKAVFPVEFRPGTLEAVCFHRGYEQARVSLYTPAAATGLKVTPQTAAADMATDGLAYFSVEAADAAGHTAESCDGEVRVAVTGGGLVVLFTGDRQALPGRESVRLYRGRATAIVRADGTGRVVLKAEADGLKKGRASVRVKPVKAQS